MNTDILKEPAVERIFHLWVEEWEEDTRKKNDCVSEALLLQKYKGLVFHDPDFGNDFSICPKRKAEGDLLASNGGRKA